MDATNTHLAAAPKPHAGTVRHIMTRRVITLDLDDPLLKAISLFDQEHFHHVVVVSHGAVQGVVSDRDILKVISPFVGNPILERTQDVGTVKRRIHQIMTRRPVTVGPEQSVAQAAQLMLDQHVSCLPVVSNAGRLVGIVTVRDLLGQLVPAPTP